MANNLATGQPYVQVSRPTKPRRPRFGGPNSGKPVIGGRPRFGGPKNGRPIVDGGRKPFPGGPNAGRPIAPFNGGLKAAQGLDPGLHSYLIQQGRMPGYR